jgi:hypothetical protein
MSSLRATRRSSQKGLKESRFSAFTMTVGRSAQSATNWLERLVDEVGRGETGKRGQALCFGLSAEYSRWRIVIVQAFVLLLTYRRLET